MKGDKFQEKERQLPKINNQPISEEEVKRQLFKKKIMQHQIRKINSMSLQQLIQKSRNRQPYQHPSPTNLHTHRSIVNSLKAAGFEHNLQEIAKNQMQMVQKATQNRRIQRRQMRQAPILNQIKRGKLGTDNLLIIFALFGSLALPYIFYQKFEKNRGNIIKSRKYSPQVIENISDDSPIDIDSVSEQSIHYQNPTRRAQFQKKVQQVQKISRLKKQLDL